MARFNLVTPPAVEPLTLDQLKRHLRVDFDDEDDVINDANVAARERIELETQRQLITSTWELWLDHAPGYTQQADSMGLWGSLYSPAQWTEFDHWWHTAFIDVPFPPLQAVLSIKYVDTAGVLQTWDPSLYQVEATRGPLAQRGRIQPAYGQAWPVTRAQMDALVVQFTAGYGTDGDAVPFMLKRAIKLTAGDFYGQRDDTIVTKSRSTVQPLPYGVAAIVSQYRARAITRAA